MVSETEKMFSAFEKIFSTVQKIFSVTEKIFAVPTPWSLRWRNVLSLRKDLLFANTMVPWLRPWFRS
jgi:hypothetical protein